MAVIAAFLFLALRLFLVVLALGLAAVSAVLWFRQQRRVEPTPLGRGLAWSHPAWRLRA